MNLQEELSKLARELDTQVPVSGKNAFAGMVSALQKSRLVERGPKVGERIPDFALKNIHEGLATGNRIQDFSLPNPWGEMISLSEILRQGPVILNFYRGNWCPYCNVELRALQQEIPRFGRLGANLVAISLEKPDETVKTIEEKGLSFMVLSDIEGQVARRFKIVFEAPKLNEVLHRDIMGFDLAAHNGSDVARLVIPATYVIDRDFRVRFAFVDEDYRHRADIEEIVGVLREIQAEGRALEN